MKRQEPATKERLEQILREPMTGPQYKIQKLRRLRKRAQHVMQHLQNEGSQAQ